jgi:hypothetical protein
MSENISKAGTFAPVSQPARKVSVHQIWPKAVIWIGVGLTAVWICFLGYGLIKLVELVI